MDAFEFKVLTSVPTTEGANKPGVIEGVVRYHPFLYDHDESPRVNVKNPAGDGEGLEEIEVSPDLFNCFWNGRLIPKTCVNELPLDGSKSKSIVPKRLT